MRLTIKLTSKRTAPIQNGHGHSSTMTIYEISFAPLLDANFTKSELVYLLLLVANEQPLRAPGANWARYYARKFITLYTSYGEI